MKQKRACKFACLVVGLAMASSMLVGGAVPVKAQAVNGPYDAFTDFSSTNNPTPSAANPIWSYGYTATLGGAFHVYQCHLFDVNVHGTAWRISGCAVEPNISKNESGRDIEFVGEGILYPGTDYLHLHPGAGGEYSVLRWTAPAADRYVVEVIYKGLRMFDQTTTDVHVLHNNVSVFDAELVASWSDPGLTYKHPIQMAAGDTLDFAVGPDGDYVADSTGVKVTITLAPIPASVKIHPSSFVPGSHAVIHVTLLGTRQLDVSTIDTATVRFGRTGFEATPISFSVHDVNHDGKADLSFNFHIKDTGIKCFDTLAKLTGKNKTGKAVEGSISITTLGCERCPSP